MKSLITSLCPKHTPRATSPGTRPLDPQARDDILPIGREDLDKLCNVAGWLEDSALDMLATTAGLCDGKAVSAGDEIEDDVPERSIGKADSMVVNSPTEMDHASFLSGDESAISSLLSVKGRVDVYTSYATAKAYI